MTGMEQRKVIAGVLAAGTVLGACALLSRQYPSQATQLIAQLSLGSLGLAKRGTKCEDLEVQSGQDELPYDITMQGCQTAHCHFDWAQSLEEVLVEVQVPVNVTLHDVVVQFDVQSLLVLVGNKSIISGTLAGPIIPEDSSWSLGRRGSSRVLSITICKAVVNDMISDQQQYTIWDSLLCVKHNHQQQQQQHSHQQNGDEQEQQQVDRHQQDDQHQQLLQSRGKPDNLEQQQQQQQHIHVADVWPPLPGCGDDNVHAVGTQLVNNPAHDQLSRL